MDLLNTCIRRRWAAWAGTVVCCAFGIVGCLAASPEEREPQVSGNYDDGDAFHRPGQPCLLCHGEDSPVVGNPKFLVAGTVYDGIDAHEDTGISNVEVTIEDAAGHELVAVTNRAGNFFVELDQSLASPERSDPGGIRIPWRLTYPLTAHIRRGDVESTMETHIWRNGSCSHCHGAQPDEASVGRVFLERAGQP